MASSQEAIQEPSLPSQTAPTEGVSKMEAPGEPTNTSTVSGDSAFSPQSQVPPAMTESSKSKGASEDNAKRRSKPALPNVMFRHFSLRTFSFAQPREEHKPIVSTTQDHERKKLATIAFSKRFIKIRSAEKRAKESALVVRALIVGPPAVASPKVTSMYAKPQLNKVKSQLIQPKSANKVIAQLRALSPRDEPAASKDSSKASKAGNAGGLIHAVCLEHSDAEEDEIHFSRLASEDTEDPKAALVSKPADISFAPLDKLSEVFNDMHIVDLVTSPDLGLGQPGNGDGVLAGAVPTAETVIRGIEMITPQLMALGYATGQSVMPNHTGIYPPKDRMSVLTYWWGLELVLPPPSLAYLANAKSIAGTVVNFLTALSMAYNGVREIMPFVRYIAQFIDYEFNVIKAQDQGNGVVCAATWIMPAAMVPRPWDFPDPPTETILPIDDKAPKSDGPASNPPDVPKPPLETSPTPLPLPTLPLPLSPAQAVMIESTTADGSITVAASSDA